MSSIRLTRAGRNTRTAVIALAFAIPLGWNANIAIDAMHPATPTPIPSISEDDPNWNCLTMGNRQCGPDWVPVPAANATDIGHAGCYWSIGPTTWVACPDGYVTNS